MRAKILDKSLLASINKRLEVIINILLQQPGPEAGARKVREQVQLLHTAGLKPKEIAEILGKSSVYVNKEISSLRKTGKVG